MDSEKIKAGMRPAEWYEKENQAMIPRPERIFTVPERICAWGMIALGYGLFRACPVYEYPLGGMLLLWALFGLTLFTLGKGGHPVRGMALAVCLSALPVSLAMFCSGNAMIQTAAFLYGMAAYAYTVYAACGNTLEEGLSDLLPMDLLRAVFVLPFGAFGSLVQAVGGGGIWKKSGKILLRVFGGLSLAMLPTLLAVSLLSYDSKFRSSMNDLVSLDLGDLFGHLLDLGLGLLLALYLFGLYTSATEKRCAALLTAAGCRDVAGRMHSFSPVTICSSACPVLFIYGVFFFSQWENYVSAFRGTLPENILYSEYAREGFFELCAVSFLNLVLLTATGMFTRRSDTGTNRAHPAVRVLHVLLAVCTLVLIATAVSKMFLYIEAYGLTPKRVYATWFMAVLTLVFVLVIVKQFVPRLRLIALSMAVCVGMFALLGLTDVEGRIAAYNVDRYLAGTLEEPDFAGLGASAVPEKIRGGLYRPVHPALTEFHTEDWENSNPFTLTLPELRAKAAVAEWGDMQR